MFFRDIVGQNAVKQSLIDSVQSGKIPHARLFTGLEGLGKLGLAIAYAQYLNCESPTKSDSCGICASCRKISRLAHPDLHFVFPIIKKSKQNKNICDDYLPEWREMFANGPYFHYNQWLEHIGAENQQGLIYSQESEEILRKLNLKAYEAKYKIMIIWLPEKLHEACANKLLKILEEPFDNTVFLMVSNTPDLIISTIRSRCQRINIHGLDEDIMSANLLTKYPDIDEQDILSSVRLAKGSYLNALDFINEKEEHLFFFDLFVKMMRISYMRNIKDIKSISLALASIGREKQKKFLMYSQQMIREYFVSNLNKSELVYLAKDESDFGARFAPFINEKNIIELMDELSLAERHIEQNVNAKMVFFDLCLQITVLIKQ